MNILRAVLWLLGIALLFYAKPFMGNAGFIIFSLTITFLLFHNQQPAKKWSDEKVEDERLRIEKITNPTNKDLRSIAEYLIQRYTRNKINCTQAQYNQTIDELVRKGESAKNKPKKDVTLFKSHDSRETPVSKDEFFQFVVPHVRLLGYWPEDFDKETDAFIAEDLWNMLQTMQEWEIQQALFDKWGYLNIDSKYVASAVKSAFRSYREFKTAKINGYETVRVITGNHDCGADKPSEINVCEMENAYNGKGSNSFLVPFVCCKFNASESGGLCQCCFSSGFRLGDDRELYDFVRLSSKTVSHSS